jgi:hypothetical protein
VAWEGVFFRQYLFYPVPVQNIICLVRGRRSMFFLKCHPSSLLNDKFTHGTLEYNCSETSVQKSQILAKCQYANNANNPFQTKMALVFALGYTTNVSVESAIEEESNKHHDIIQEDFIDTYRNLTYKVGNRSWIYKINSHFPSGYNVAEIC